MLPSIELQRVKQDLVMNSNYRDDLCIWDDVFGLHANTTPFYIRDLSICGFWYLRRILGTCPLHIQRGNCKSVLVIIATFKYKPSQPFFLLFVCLKFPFTSSTRILSLFL